MVWCQNWFWKRTQSSFRYPKQQRQTEISPTSPLHIKVSEQGEEQMHGQFDQHVHHAQRAWSHVPLCSHKHGTYAIFSMQHRRHVCQTGRPAYQEPVRNPRLSLGQFQKQPTCVANPEFGSCSRLLLQMKWDVIYCSCRETLAYHFRSTSVMTKHAWAKHAESKVSRAWCNDLCKDAGVTLHEEAWLAAQSLFVRTLLHRE